MKIEEVSEKIKDAKSFEEMKAILTTEELIFYLMKYGKWSEDMLEGDECLVIEVIKILSANGCSARHLIHLLDVAKETALSLARIELK